MQSLRVSNGQWACAKVPVEKAPQMPTGHPEAIRETFYIAIVQRAFGDQSQSALYSRRGSGPGWRTRRTLRTAAQTGTKARLTRSRGRRKEPDILGLRWIGRTDWAAVYAGGLYADVEKAIESRISG